MTPELCVYMYIYTHIHIYVYSRHQEVQVSLQKEFMGISATVQSRGDRIHRLTSVKGNTVSKKEKNQYSSEDYNRMWSLSMYLTVLLTLSKTTQHMKKMRKHDPLKRKK